VGAEEPNPDTLLPIDDAAPEADRGTDLLAPEPAALIGLDRLVEVACQPQPLELSRLGLIHEVFRRMEDPGVEIPLLGAVRLCGGRGEHLEDDVRHASAFFPGDPGLALAVRVDTTHPEDVRSAEGLLRKVVSHLFRD